MKRKVILNQFVLYPDPLKTLKDAPTQLDVEESILKVTGLQRGRRLEYIARRWYDKGNLWYLTHVLAKSRRLSGDDEYNSFKIDEPVLLVGRINHLKEASITAYHELLGGRYQISYRLGAWRGTIDFGLEESTDNIDKREQLEIAVSAGKTCRDSPFKLVIERNSSMQGN